MKTTKSLKSLILLLSAGLLLSSVGAEVAEVYAYLAANVPCSITIGTFNKTSALAFDAKSSTWATGAYYSSAFGNNYDFALALVGTGDRAVVAGAAVDTTYVFDGWYSKSGAWPTDKLIPPKLSEANVRLTTDKTLTPTTLATAGTWNNNYPVAFAKYVKTWAITVSATTGGTVAKSPNETRHRNGSTVTLTATPKTGYRVTGWTKNGATIANSADKTTLEIVAAGDDKYVVSFALKNYSVTFIDSRQDGFESVVKSVQHGQSAVAPEWSRPGYTLSWNGSFVNVTSDRTIAAVWTPVQVTVSFDANYPGAAAVPPQTATYGSAYGELPRLQRDGYAFAGWFTAKEGGERIESSTTSAATADQTLYAHWTPNAFKVAFRSNGGTGGPMDDQPFVYGVSQSLDGNSFTKDGSSFAGWNTQSDGTGTAYADKATVSNLTTVAAGTFILYAQWKPVTFTVKFDPNGGEGKMPDQKFTNGVFQTLTPNRFTLAGSSFSHWSTNTGMLYDDKARGDTLTTTDDGVVILYAQWSTHRYAVRFCGNGGQGEMPDQPFVYGEARSLTSNAFVRTGFDFAGWSTDPARAAEYADGAEVSNLTDDDDGLVVLYAKWRSKAEGLDNPLSIAADCATNHGECVAVNLTTNLLNTCYPTEDGTCLKLCPNNSSSVVTLKANLSGAGKLTFSYKVVIDGQPDEGSSYFRFNNGDKVSTNCVSWAEKTWIKATAGSDEVVWLYQNDFVSYGKNDYVLIDNIRWAPDVKPDLWLGVTFRDAAGGVFSNVTLKAAQPFGELPALTNAAGVVCTWTYGGEAVTAETLVPYEESVELLPRWEAHPVPVPVDDAVTVSSFSCADGVGTLTFAGDPDFDYRVLTNADLSVADGWAPMGDPQPGQAEMTFGPLAVEGIPQLFFKVETLQKRD